MWGGFYISCIIFICFSSISAAGARNSAEEVLLLIALQPESIEKVWGKEAFQDVPVYDPELEEYQGPNRAMDTNIQFVLSTSHKPWKEAQIFLGNEDSLKRGGFNSSWGTKIICHGFMSDYLQGPGKDLNPAYFKFGANPVNIISVNWAQMAGIHTTRPKNSTKEWYDIFYFPPARNTELVGNQTGLLLEFLVKRLGVELEKLHLIGHSLGAHVMGWAGRYVRSALQGRVERLTALDPAAPCFETNVRCFNGNYRHLRKSDAKFVDVIHTHARAFGMKTPVGHADFYPNGGFTQPGCSWTTFGQCSHRRAVDLMADSIKFSKFSFFAQRCPSWETYIGGNCNSTDFALLGEHCSPKARGLFFLSTAPKQQSEERVIF